MGVVHDGIFILAYVLTVLNTFVTEIHGREPVRPTADVADIVKDINKFRFNSYTANSDDTIILQCSLDIQKDLPKANEAQPLYLRPEMAAFWLPNEKGRLQLEHGASIELYCSSAFANVTSEAHSPKISKRIRILRPRCLQGNMFEWNGGKYELRHFVCERPVKYVVQQTGVQCGGEVSSSQIYRIGYNITKGRFVETMQVCHSQDALQTHYTRHLLQPASVHFQRHVQRLNFSRGGFFELHNMNELYSQHHQRQQAVKLLGLETVGGANASLLFNDKGMFLSRGHLAAKADLIYASQQRTTFTYFNVAPQWQHFNGGQWLTVEDETRKYVARTGKNIVCYTGTWGVMQLGVASGMRHDFYLTNDENNNGLLPVPMVYYRVIVEQPDGMEDAQRGLALIGVNNPHATQQEIDESYIICEDIHDQVPWLRWMRNKSLKKGYIYACRVSDLAKVVGHLPKELTLIYDLLM